jgi:predicted transcriptional regulator
MWLRRLRKAEPEALSALGPLERRMMEALWSSPVSLPARDVLERFDPPLAYTTVTTTLDRLCKKNLVTRTKVDRAFLYQPRYTRAQMDEMEARRAIQQLSSPGQLASCLVDAVTEQDVALLDELEATIRRKRQELKRISKP